MSKREFAKISRLPLELNAAFFYRKLRSFIEAAFDLSYFEAETMSAGKVDSPKRPEQPKPGATGDDLTKKLDVNTLEEDDEFEEFPVEGKEFWDFE